MATAGAAEARGATASVAVLGNAHAPSEASWSGTGASRCAGNDVAERRWVPSNVTLRVRRVGGGRRGVGGRAATEQQRCTRSDAEVAPLHNHLGRPKIDKMMLAAGHQTREIMGILHVGLPVLRGKHEPRHRRPFHRLATLRQPPPCTLIRSTLKDSPRAQQGNFCHCLRPLHLPLPCPLLLCTAWPSCVCSFARPHPTAPLIRLHPFTHRVASSSRSHSACCSHVLEAHEEYVRVRGVHCIR